jgi:hypothetical protein
MMQGLSLKGNPTVSIIKSMKLFELKLVEGIETENPGSQESSTLTQLRILGITNQEF